MKAFWKVVIAPTLIWILAFTPVCALVEAVSYVTGCEGARGILILWGCFLTLVMYKYGAFDRDEE